MGIHERLLERTCRSGNLFITGTMATEVERKAAIEVAEIARRLQEAKENNVLDLINCGLMKVPDAVYMILRGTPIQACLLSRNQLKNVPRKLPINFNQLKELNISHNTISDCPPEMLVLTDLQVLDISVNRFSSVPEVVYRYSKLQLLRLNHNAISEIDVGKLAQMSCLQEVDLRCNPLTPEVKYRLLETGLRVLLDDVGREESMSVD